VYFNRQIFFPNYDGRFTTATQTQIHGLDFLLTQLEFDERITMIREVAYILATVQGESSTFQPIKERRASRTRQPALYQTQQRYWPSGFYGRGYVQLTHESNYRKAGTKLTGTIIELANPDGSQRTITVDTETFVNEPDLVMQPSIAYLILSRGMLEGWFRKRSNGTPYKLSDFIKEGEAPDYPGARNIINHPSSRAAEFAGFADKFELILRASNFDENAGD
jgi:hypothetical protein